MHITEHTALPTPSPQVEDVNMNNIMSVKALQRQLRLLNDEYIYTSNLFSLLFSFSDHFYQ